MMSISEAELSSFEEIDNMSLSDIIKARFKNKEAIKEIKTPQEVAAIIIKSPEEANQVSNVEGDSLVQEAY